MNFDQQLLSIDDTNNLYLSFELEDKTYAINAKNVLEVTSLPLLNKPQRLPEYIAGILNYNDLFINVIDIRKILALPVKNYTLNNKVIIMKGEESLIAMIVDEVKDFFSAVPSQIHRIMGESSHVIVRTFYKLNEKTVNIINVSMIEEVVKKNSSKENDIDYKTLFPTDEDSLCILQRRSTNIAASPKFDLEADFFAKDQYVIFRINNHSYCIYSYYVKELINYKNYPVTRIPYTPEYIKGIINLKGFFYTVIDLKRFIDIGDVENVEDSSVDKKMIVLELSEMKLALLVDDVIDIVNLSKDKIVKKNEMGLDNLFIQAEACIDDKVYNILNVEKLINDDRLYIDCTS